jgi:GH15 family glucan-1,4-alpha-glucosidase
MDGSIDWCCFPHIESASIFAGILDIKKGGHFSIRPKESFKSAQEYVKNTNVLNTTFETSEGTVVLTDFMPMKEGHDFGVHELQAIFRKITSVRGDVEIDIDFRPRFDFARVKTTFEEYDWGVLALTGDEKACLTSPFKLNTGEDGATGSYTIEEGETCWFALQYGLDIYIDPAVCENALEDTLSYWQAWAHTCDLGSCVFHGPWHDLIVRSGLVLKLLTHHETGAICAAPTTSLPEEIGGLRNWDYRFNWVRDSAFTAQALQSIGHKEEAENNLKWFLDICRGAHEPRDIQIMYGLHGEAELEEHELSHLSGYRDSRPVRIGNAASKQKQLDIYGELLNAFYQTAKGGEDIPEEDWEYILKIVDYVCDVWATKDSGIWEVRGGPEHFTYSKLMCWVALDRGLKISKLKGYKAPVSKWEKCKDEIKNAILDRGFSTELNSFVRVFDGEALDATSLLVPVVGFLPFDDSRVQGTIDATIEGLTDENGLVYRYLKEDGLPGKEGSFTLCSFWLVSVLALSGRVKEAEDVFENILKYISPLGLFAEEIDPETGEHLGNFPQAFSHIGLINSAFYLGKHEERG